MPELKNRNMLQNARTSEMWLKIALVGTYCVGLATPIIDVDAAQYAAISMEMCQRGEYLQITERGIDYLDKPPMLFWLACLSYHLFGFTAIAYKLPSLVISLIGLWSTQQLGTILHGRQTGQMAILVLATSMGVFWALNDVKTDAILMSAVVYSVHQWLAYLTKPSWWHLVGAGIGMGVALLTKGPMGLIFPLFLIGIYLISKRQFKEIFKWQWLIPISIALLSCLPMAWGLYQQFDLHPEKEILGRTHVSGLRFFFWEQSFGRITGENQWSNDTSFFFLFHSALLLLIPFSGLAITGMIRQAKLWLFRKSGECMTWAGSVFLLAALGLSSYQLPHYALVVLPFLAIVIAKEWRFCQQNKPSWFQWYVRILLGASTVILLFCMWAFGWSWAIGVAIGLFGGAIITARKKGFHSHALIVVGLLLGWLINAQALPALTSYSQSQRLVELLQNLEDEFPVQELCFYNVQSRAIEFELKQRMPIIDAATIEHHLQENPTSWFYTDKKGKDQLIQLGYSFSVQHQLNEHGLSRVPLSFLNPSTRENELKPCFLLRLSPTNLH